LILFLDTFVSFQNRPQLKFFRTILLMLLALGSGAFFCQAQTVVATIEGTLSDQVTQAPIEGVLVSLTSIEGKSQTTVSDAQGRFHLEVTPGRYICEVSVLGYSPARQEALAVSGRTLRLRFSLVEHATELEGVTITPRSSDRDEEISLPIEKVLRMPANFFDPVRMLTSYPNVVAANDQANNIIVKGSSPSGLLWRLNGMDIVNPNHLANAGTINDKPTANGGGVNILSAQMLDRTSFYSGNIPARYGNVTSGVLDMNLREGNSQKREYTAQASLIGLDFAAEGPLNKKKTASFLVNYRYSTVGLLSKLGVNFGGETINFQDLSFHLKSQVGKRGTLSLFGLGGLSSNRFNAKDSSEWEVDKDRFNIYYKSNMGAVGARYDQHLGRLNLATGATLSSNDQSRESASIETARLPFQSSEYLLTQRLLSSFVSISGALSEAVSLDAGVMVNHISDDLFNDEKYPDETSTLHAASNNASFSVVQPYAQMNLRKGNFTAEVGGRYSFETLRSEQSADYRLNVEYAFSPTMSVGATAGRVSQLPQPGTYLSNDNLDMGYMHKRITEVYHIWNVSAWKATTTAYYHLYSDVPVGNFDYSVLNVMDGVAPAYLSPVGGGVNKGLSLQVERSFLSNFYLLAGSSYYDSKFDIGSEQFPTRFSGKYSLITTIGRETSKDRSSSKSAFGAHLRFLFLGGLRENAINESASFNSGRTVSTGPPNYNKLKDYKRVDLRLSWRKDKPGYTRTIAIDIQNVAAFKNEAYHYYDAFQSKILTQYQVSIIPVLVYRIDF
jgi:hypothetical protein